MLGVLPGVEFDLDRNSLDYLDEVTGGVLRREQAGTRTSCTADRSNVAVQFTIVGVNVNLRGLTRNAYP